MSQDYLQKRCELPDDQEKLREKIIGLGERSRRKSYYPELKKKLADLERFKTLLDQSNDAILLMELPSGRFTDVTRSTCRQIGYTKEECLSKTIFDIIPCASAELEQLFSGRCKSIVLDTKILKGNGEEAPFEINMRRVRFGHEDYAIAVARDITERKRAEEKLQASEANLARAQRITHLGNWTWDLICDRFDGSMEFLRMFCLENLECISYDDFIVRVHLWDRERVNNAVRAALSGKAHYSIDYRIVLPDGMERVVHAEGEVARDNAGRPVTFFGTVQDITERKQAEEERERLLLEIDGQRRRLQTILDTLPVGLFIADTRGRIILANGAARGITGGVFPDTLDELVKIRMWWADTGKPFKLEESGVPRALREGEATANDVIEFERPNGSHAIYICSSAPLFDARGKITGVMVISVDITEMRRLEKDLDQSRQQAQLYLDLMSHDITNMNQALMGYLELMEAMQESGKIDRGLIDSSIEIINRSSRMINDVKKLTRIQSGNIQLKRVSLHEILSEVKEKYSIVPGRSVTINYTPGQDCDVRAGDLLKDVFDKLVDNAIRHSTGPVAIDIAIDQVTVEDHVYCRITVADNGPGIPPDLKKKIFGTPEDIMEKTVRRGFGMYLVRTLIDYFHGRVKVEDRVPGDYKKGAKFVVLLPPDKS